MAKSGSDVPRSPACYGITAFRLAICGLRLLQQIYFAMHNPRLASVEFAKVLMDHRDSLWDSPARRLFESKTRGGVERRHAARHAREPGGT